MASNTRFPFVFVFNGSHGQRTFATMAELAMWVEQELNAYRPLIEIRLSRGDEAYGGFLKNFRQIKLAGDQCLGLVNLLTDEHSREFGRLFNSLDAHLGNAYHVAGVPPSDSLEVKALMPIIQEDEQAALAALFALSNPTQPMALGGIDAAMARGFGLAASIRYRMFGGQASTALNEAVNSTLGTVKAQSDETYNKVLQRIELVDDLEVRADKVIQESAEKVNVAVGELQQLVKAETEEATEAIAAFKKAYQAEIALKEPVAFWQEKADRHRTLSGYFGGASLAVGVLFATAAWCQLPSLLAPKVQAAAKVATAPASDMSKAAAGAAVEAAINGAPSYFGIALAVLFSTLALWLLRILVRGYLSETHLKTDAEERVAMVKTYLALMESGRAPTDTLGPVLIALFRPASDGIVKDDSMPMSVAELLSRQKG